MDKRLDSPTSHRPMNIEDAISWVRWNAPSVGRLCRLGEKEALRLRFAWEACYRNPTDPALQNELLVIVQDYIRRQLTLAERVVLDDRFGVFSDPKKP